MKQLNVDEVRRRLLSRPEVSKTSPVPDFRDLGGDDSVFTSRSSSNVPMMKDIHDPNVRLTNLEVRVNTLKLENEVLGQEILRLKEAHNSLLSRVSGLLSGQTAGKF